ncbi:MAG: sigma-70 family RNA polymerase sigma factor [Planctomycetes bacterium]|nr:sigma-70 family RNA polymerase sigma factor [Planctomycetota bacterium]
MALSAKDRNLLQRCLARRPGAWEEFVNRFLGLVVHVINHTAMSRSLTLVQDEREDLAAEVFLTLVSNDFAALRRFRGDSSLATYLTVIARRVVVRELLKRKPALPSHRSEDEAAGRNGEGAVEHAADPAAGAEVERLNNRDEIERLLEGLDGDEAEVVRLYHLEGKSYREISAEVGIAENSVGPTLTRARAKMRQVKAEADTST